MRTLKIAGLTLVLLGGMGGWSCSDDTAGSGENCANQIDDDGDGAVDCVDSECRAKDICQANPEFCSDGLDNDLDGDVDCVDADCAALPQCSEDCGNGVDDNGDGRADCEDPECRGIDPACGEVCGDGLDNDGDGKVDCADADCAEVIPPCGTTANPDGTTCAYGDTPEHTCACADGIDNDGDGQTDTDDLHCFGPFDDDEATYATGIPGDNKGSKANRECPFDGNSGTGNDGVCCNLANPGENVTPNGCDEKGCCEIDANGNGTGEHVFISGDCDFTLACAAGSTLGCSCAADADCDAGQFCVPDDDLGPGFCSTCETCEPNPECDNTCACGEQCYGGFSQPDSLCGADPGGDCGVGVTACPNGTADCDPANNEVCTNGCCYGSCAPGVTPCQVSSDCPTEFLYYCITGCCVEVPS
jgi:hypothetical protein